MLLVFTILYFVSMALYYMGLNRVASVIMIALALLLFLQEIIVKKRIINIKSLFSLGFIGGFGLSLLKLSNLSSTYNIMTFLIVYVSYFSIYVGGFIANKSIKEKTNIYKEVSINKTEKKVNTQDILVIILILITFASFAMEVLLLGFIPAFIKDTPHAYSTFHIFGVHYITTLYVFIPGISVCNYFVDDKSFKSLVMIIISLVYVIALAMLMVSRAQLIFSIILTLFVMIINQNEVIVKKFEKLKYKDKNAKTENKKVLTKFLIVILCLSLFVGIYVIITIKRAHDVTYLMGIFDMKDKYMPIFIAQPYMYIAHNFENLNYMVENTFRWTFGRRMLAPFFTLTLIKKFFPIVALSPIYVIKEELSTVTLVYDAYYDFGLVGVIVFCFIIGYIGKKIEDKVYNLFSEEYKNNYIIIVFAVFSYYMLFSFFQTYFSLTETWIYFILLFILYKLFVMSKHVTQKQIVKVIKSETHNEQKNAYKQTTKDVSDMQNLDIMEN